ncbi:MAG TPA: hypothetical protein VFG52_05980 [Xanthomonadales bacterium]|nr:hypothetical protein [Xanthomonadales bacterium]
MCSVWSLAAQADLTLQGINTPGVTGAPDYYTVYLKDEQMRVDQFLPGAGGEAGQLTNTVLIRFSGNPAGIVLLDHGARTATLLSSLTPLPEDTATREVQVFKRNGQRELLGSLTDGYDYSLSGKLDPAALAGLQLPAEMVAAIQVRLLVTGSVWVAPGREGSEELSAFLTRLASHQVSTHMVTNALGVMGGDSSAVSTGLVSGLVNVFRQMAHQGLPVYATTTSDAKVDSQGYVAVLAQGVLDETGIGESSTETRLTHADVNPVDADLFYGGGLPQNYPLTAPP